MKLSEQAKKLQNLFKKKANEEAPEKVILRRAQRATRRLDRSLKTGDSGLALRLCREPTTNKNGKNGYNLSVYLTQRTNSDGTLNEKMSSDDLILKLSVSVSPTHKKGTLSVTSKILKSVSDKCVGFENTITKPRNDGLFDMTNLVFKACLLESLAAGDESQQVTTDLLQEDQKPKDPSA